MFNSKKKQKEELLNSFGKIKNEDFDFELIEKYFRNKDNSDSFQTISDKTCNDLDFNEMFMFIDRTTSKTGQQFLYNKFRNINKDNSENTINEKLIEDFSNNSEFRLKIQQLLAKLNKTDAYYISSLFQEEHLQKPKWFFLVPLLSFTSIASLLLTIFLNSKFFLILVIVFTINLVIHYFNKRNLYQYLSSIPELFKLNKIAKKLFEQKSLKQLNPNLKKSLNIVNKVRNLMAFFKLSNKAEGEFEALFWIMLEFIKIMFLIEPIFLFKILDNLENKKTEIEDIFIFVGKIDALISIASLRKGLTSFCIPKISETKPEIIAKKIYHPLILNCIKNDISVKEKSILLTGSNMSGKTSFIRTVGLNIITGLTLNTCFAESITIPRARIFSAIRISDDLLNDKSYYFEEVLTIKEMIDESKNEKINLFLLDEIFKGTNTIERISAGKSVLSALAKNNNIVFVSTHDIELADLLNKEYELYHFSEIVENKKVAFDYKLKEGKLKNRNAIRILEINNYPKEIISEAIEISKKLDSTTFKLKI